MYDDKHMLKAVQHATASALNNNQKATATKLDRKQRQRFSQKLHDNKDVCTILGNIPKKKKMRDMPLLTSKAKHHDPG